MPLRSTLSRALLITLLLGAIAPGGGEPIPWPAGEAPDSAAIDALVADALVIEQREQFEEWLAAAEANEDSDHLAIFQDDLDNGVFDKAKMFQFGDELFSHEFKLEDGYGDGTFTHFRRVHTGVRGGLDTFSCAGCHSVGGPDGAGSQTQNALLGGDGDHATSANIRNAPAMLGLGIVQTLAAEMTRTLQYQLSAAKDEAKKANKPVQVDLVTKVTTFGSVLAYPDGTVDVSKVEGVDADLVVKPFGWKGSQARLRRFVEDAARVHFDIQSHVLALNAKDHPDPAHLGQGPNWWDPDDDGHSRELEEGTLTVGAVYLALLETPVILPPHDPGLRDRWANGSALFTQVGCAECHKPAVALDTTEWHETADTTAGDVVIRLFEEGDPPRGTNLVNLFGDLKRHAMGPELADPHGNEQGLPRDVFLTRPLWGLAETAPYLHDGRAATIPDAILAHGGESKKSRDAFAALSSHEQADVHIFLLSLTRQPKVRVAR